MKYIFIVLLFLSVVKAGVTSIENNISTPIVDNSCINKIFDMPISKIITDIKISTNITHTWRGDLNLTLTSPLGTSVDLTSRNGRSANNIYVNFSDAAATSIVGDTTSYTVMVDRRPEVGLNAFDGEDAFGLWNLQICDNAAGDVGTYNYGRLDINDTVVPISNSLQVDYRMDECYWMDGAGGIIADVKDSSSNQYDATSSGTATLIRSGVNPPLCNYGSFSVQPDLVDADDGTAGNTAGGITVSVWLNPSAMTNWQAIVTKSKAYSWNDGWGIVHYSGDANNIIRFFVNSYTNNLSGILTLNTWNHVVATYDNTTMRLYINGVEVSNLPYNSPIVNSATTDPLRIAYDATGDDEYIGSVDEVKMWGKALSASEILSIYTNEVAGNNYDGTPRVCPTCDANLTGSTWELVGIPADLRTAVNKDVATVFDELPGATYDTIGDPNDWLVVKRSYDVVTNASSYAIVPYTGEPLQLGQGYWIISTQPVIWSENGLPSVDYNSTNGACVTNSCIEIDLVENNKNFGAPDYDPDDGSGPYSDNMLGFVGHVPVDWADCRIIVTDINGTTAYTPSGAETAGYASKQVWQYNPGASSTDADGYTTCDDVTPGGCKLEPYRGFWVQLKGITKGTTVKLLIPKAL